MYQIIIHIWPRFFQRIHKLIQHVQRRCGVYVWHSPQNTAATIAAGANAITYTPPSAAFLFKEMMEKYREES